MQVYQLRGFIRLNSPGCIQSTNTLYAPALGESQKSLSNVSICSRLTPQVQYILNFAASLSQFSTFRIAYRFCVSFKCKFLLLPHYKCSAFHQGHNFSKSWDHLISIILSKYFKKGCTSPRFIYHLTIFKFNSIQFSFGILLSKGLEP